MVSVLLWIIKGVLLAVTLAALVLWPWSYEHSRTVWIWRFGAQPDRVELVGVMGGWDNGWIGIAKARGEYTNDWLDLGRSRANAEGTGWRCDAGPGSLRPYIVNPGGFWGPFHWEHPTMWDLGYSLAEHHAYVPFWLLALAAGAWPTASLTLLVRRRIRRRRAAREGHCRVCGYDLRATPDRCPECGAVPEVKVRTDDAGAATQGGCGITVPTPRDKPIFPG